MLVVIFTLLISVQQMVLQVNGEGHYTLIASEKLHPNSDYNVSVSVCNNENPVELKIGIEGPSSIPTQTIQMAKMMDLKLVTFKIASLKKQGTYTLTIEGVKGLIFKNTTRLLVRNTHVKLVMQTDQYQYTPGDTVNYRAVFLNDFLRPVAPSKKVVIYVTDANNKRVYEKKQISTIQGVLTDKFQVPKDAAPGQWFIKVEKTTQNVTFVVKKKPKYLVKVKATKGVYIREDKLEIRASAKYYKGKPVNGKVTVTLELTNKKISTSHVSTMTNGEAQLLLDLRQYASLLKDGATVNASVTVTITDDANGETIVGKDQTTFYPYRYLMTCPIGLMCNRYFPSKAQLMPFHITHVNGSLVNDDKSIVRVTFTEKESNTSSLKFETKLDKYSNALFEVLLTSKFSAYKVELQFKDEKHELNDILSWYHMFSQLAYTLSKRTGVPSPPFPKKEWFRIHHVTHNLVNVLSANESVHFILSSSKPLSFFNVIVVGHDTVLSAKTIVLPKPERTYSFSLKPSLFMAPYSRLYVYYLNEKNEFYHTETGMNFENDLKNKIEVIAPKEVQPGTDVTLTIKTAPNSFVGLTAVDRGLLELDGVDNEFIRLDYQAIFTQVQTHLKAQLPGKKRTKILTLTNGHPIEYNGKELKQPDPVKVPLLGDINVNHYDDHHYDRIHNSLSRTWLFDDIVQTTGNEHSFTKRIPNTGGPTTWILNAFALHPEEGLAVEKKIVTILAKKPGPV